MSDPTRSGLAAPQRRTALISVAAACLLIAVKLSAGIPSGSHERNLNGIIPSLSLGVLY